MAHNGSAARADLCSKLDEQRKSLANAGIRIDLLNGRKALIWRLFIHRAWVSDYQALPDLDANANAVAIEHIKLENEGWEQDGTVAEPSECAW